MSSQPSTSSAKSSQKAETKTDKNPAGKMDKPITNPTESSEPTDGKSKADLRRERRALQEQQRALKASGAKPVPNKNTNTANKPKNDANNKPQAKKEINTQAPAASNSNEAQSKNNNLSVKSEVNNLTANIKVTLTINDSNTMTATTATKVVDTQSSSTKKEVKQGNQGGSVVPVKSDTAKIEKIEGGFETAPDTLKITRKKQQDVKEETTTNGYNKSKLFHHFDQYKRDYSIVEKYNLDNPTVHPKFIKLGIEFAHDKISGSSARCIGFLKAFKEFLNDYKASTKESRTISKDLESKLKPNINFLTQCRPLSISMGNAIKEMKQIILHLTNQTTEAEAKRILNDEIDKFIDEKILLAAQTITKFMLADVDTIISGTSYARSKITDKDCVLIYGYSSLVTHVLIEARRKFPEMHVIVVDSRPKYKGRTSLEQLLKHDINCTYVLINAVSYVMSKVTKVILSAHALLANGYVMHSVGSSQLALLAKSFNVPVVVCCETYKFCDKVQTDALVNNELGNPLDLLSISSKSFENEPSPLANYSIDNKEYENLTILNLSYDVTPPDLISCVVTDMGMLPCTSVPVVLRLKNRDNILGKKSPSLQQADELKSI